LIEDYAEKLNQKPSKRSKSNARFGDERTEFVTTNARVMEYKAKEREILKECVL
jgi:glycyl-tRNA synthetase